MTEKVVICSNNLYMVGLPQKLLTSTARMSECNLPGDGDLLEVELGPLLLFWKYS